MRLPFLSLLAAAVGLALMGSPVAAQQITLSLGATSGMPQNEFRDGLDRIGFGITGAVLYGIGPVALGAEGGLMTYDRTAQPLPARVGDRSVLLGDVEQASRIGHLHAVARLQLPEGGVRPYVDGLFGVQRFTTHTRFQQDVVIVGDALLGPNAVDRSRTTTSLDADDVALSYGAGAGVLVRVARGTDAGVPFEAFIDLGARYLFGEPARYRPASAAATADGLPTVTLQESRTDVLRPQVSLVVQFR